MLRNIEFRWIDWNRDHATSHGCSIAEIESIVRHAGHGMTLDIGNSKYLVEGRGQGGRLVRVIFLKDPEGTLFVIHAMPLKTRRRRRGR
jgi:hypothetical protein